MWLYIRYPETHRPLPHKSRAAFVWCLNFQQLLPPSPLNIISRHLEIKHTQGSYLGLICITIRGQEEFIIVIRGVGNHCIRICSAHGSCYTFRWLLCVTQQIKSPSLILIVLWVSDRLSSHDIEETQDGQLIRFLTEATLNFMSVTPVLMFGQVK